MAFKGTYTEQQLRQMIDGLYSTIGLRMEIVDNVSVRGFSEKDFVAACDVIIAHMELPIAVVPDFSSLFNRSKMVKTSENTASGAAARVTIPGNLPAYGSKELVDFPITVELSGEALDNAYMVLTQMSHEFSHVYLYAYRDPQKSSEHATDLCALMLGFDPYWRKGRKIVSRTLTTTRTITQGYLSDDEYKLAVKYIGSLRAQFADRIDQARKCAMRLRDTSRGVRSSIENLYRLLSAYTSRGSKPGRRADTEALSRISAKPYRHELSSRLKDIADRTNKVVAMVNGKHVWREADKAWLDRCLQHLQRLLSDLNALASRINGDISILKRNI